MAKNDILIQIKDAEANAGSIVDSANSTARDDIANAKVDARNIIKDAEEAAAEHARSIVTTAENNLVKERAELIEQGNTDAKTIIESANVNIPKAVDFLVGDFEREINAGA